MKAFNVTTTAQQVAAAGNRDFVHLQNVSDTDIYVKYDGSAAALTTTNGLKIIPGGYLILNNDGSRNVFTQAVWAIHGGTGNKEVRIQGAD